MLISHGSKDPKLRYAFNKCYNSKLQIGRISVNVSISGYLQLLRLVALCSCWSTDHTLIYHLQEALKAQHIITLGEVCKVRKYAEIFEVYKGPKYSKMSGIILLCFACLLLTLGGGLTYWVSCLCRGTLSRHLDHWILC